MAEWTEGGQRCLDTSELDVDVFAAELASISLRGDELTDPTGRFQGVGRRQGDPAPPEFGGRLTSLAITERTGPGRPDLNLSVQIEQRPPGLDGLLDARIEPGSVKTEIEGRAAMRSSPERNDAGTFMATTLSDGSLLPIHWSEEGARHRALNDAAIHRIDEALRHLATSLRPRTSADDDLVARLATRSDADDQVLPPCVERWPDPVGPSRRHSRSRASRRSTAHETTGREIL